MQDEEIEKFDNIAKAIKLIGEVFLKEYFGTCSEFEENCICCKKWKALEYLTEPWDVKN